MLDTFETDSICICSSQFDMSLVEDEMNNFRWLLGTCGHLILYTPLR